MAGLRREERGAATARAARRVGSRLTAAARGGAAGSGRARRVFAAA
jgi:hypothetical protein